MEQQLRELMQHFDVLSERLMLKRPPVTGSDPELSRQEVRAVMMLGGKGTITMSDLARAMNSALSTATNTVDRLVGKELVERTRVDEDRRVVQVRLSEKGERVCQPYREYKLAMGRSMLEALSAGEREIFLELMARMTRPVQESLENELTHHVGG